MSIINKVAGGLANITTYSPTTGAISAITVPGNITAASFYGDGGNLSNINAANVTGAYANSNVANYLPTYTGNLVSLTGQVITTGNITGNYILGNGSHLTGLYSNTNAAAYLGNATTTGNIYGGLITATSNIIGANIIGNGQFLSNINIANIAGSYSNANVANYLPIYAGNLNANIITANGASFNGNVGVTGNLTVAGNLNYQNVTDLAVGDPLIYIGANNTTNLVDLGIIGQYNTGTDLHTGLVWDHTVSTWKVFSNLVNEPTTVVDWANTTLSAFQAGWFIGDGGNLSNINATNIVGAYGNANVGGYLPTYTGNLVSLTGQVITTANITGANIITGGEVSATGNVTGANLVTIGDVNATGNIIGANIVGNGQFLSNINIANIAGSYSNANVGGYLPTANVAILGTTITATLFSGDGGELSNIQYSNLVGAYSNSNVASYLPTANVAILGTTITATLFSGDGGELSNIQYSNLVGAYSNSNVASYLPTANVAILGTTITAALFSGDGGQLSNIQYSNLVGAYSNSNVASYLPTYTGELTAGNANISGNVVAALFSGDGGQLSNIQYSNLVGAYSNSNVASYLPTYTGELTAGNANISGNVVAALFSGDGGQLSNIQYSNLVGAYSNSNVATYLPTANVAILGTTITGSLFSGDGGELSNIQAANIIGAYSNSNVATYLPTANVDVLGDTITATLFSGDGSQISNINIANIAGSYSNSNVATYLPTANVAILGTTITGSLFNGDGGGLSNIQGGNITGAINISPNNLTAGNATFNGNISVVGNVTVSGNLNYQDVTDLVVGDPLIYIGANNTADIVDLGLIASYDPGAGELHTGFVRDHTDGTWKLFTDLVNEPTTVVDWANATLGALEAGTFIGDGGFLSNIQAANIVGAYSNSNVATYLPTANVAILGTTITGALFIGDGGGLSNINIANIAGSYSNSNVATYLPTANVDILGDTITAALFSGNGSALTNLPYDNAIVSGTSNIAFASANGNIVFSVAGNIVGQLTFQDNVNFGNYAGESGQYSGAVAIGANTGTTNQGYNTVAVGFGAGNDSQSDYAVAIGQYAGAVTQGASATAVGDGAGNYQQGTQAVAVGFGAGNFGQLADAIAVGTAAGQSDQGTNAIAIGQNAGQNSQGANAIAIGLNAGTNQAANSIIINATGNILDTTDSGLYIDPVRNDVSNVANVVYYNTDTKELTYAPAAELYGNANVEAYLPTYTGNLSPSNLSVTELSDFGAIGNITISGGSSGQFLTTDGTGNLSFGDPISAVPAIYFTANANANNQTFSNIYLSAFGANTDITLFYNGALLENTYYSLSGSTLTVNTPLKVNDSICISQQFVSNANPVTMIPRSNDVITAATITPNVEYADQYDVLALAEALTVAAPTGVAQNAQRLTIRIKDNGVSQTLSWNAIYREIGTSLPGATVAGKLLYVGCIYNSQDTTWDVVSVAIQA